MCELCDTELVSLREDIKRYQKLLDEWRAQIHSDFKAEEIKEFEELLISLQAIERSWTLDLDMPEA